MTLRWVIFAVGVFALWLLFIYALMRIAAIADRRAERWAESLPAYSDERRIPVKRGPYDWEAGGDFDG